MLKESIILLCICLVAHGSPPNIVFIVADDLGWNDVGFHNPDIKSPNLDQLAREGVEFGHAYVQPLCTPSRHAFMTGIYPFRAGLQSGIIQNEVPECSPLDMKFFPEKLQELGYSTHIVGKWHLGFCNMNCTPTHRGFDSFLGFYSGGEDYYTKLANHYLDFRNGEAPATDDKYSTFTYSQRASDIIKAHDVSKPLFLYVPFQDVHSPLQVPSQYSDMYPNLNTDGRKQLSGMVTVMDEAVGNITKALADKGIKDNTVIIFTSDNGGAPQYHGNNYPLRGAKGTLYEGGTKAASFIHGTGLTRTGYVYHGLIHAVDWHPTILGIAGGQADAGIDGLNLWEEIRHGLPSKRTELVYNLDDSGQSPGAAIRMGAFKLITGNPGSSGDWYLPDVEFANQVHHSAHIIGRRAGDEEDSGKCSSSNEYAQRSNSPGTRETHADQLFNIQHDPNEHIDVSNARPWMVQQLKARLDEYRQKYVAPGNHQPSAAADPTNFGGYWSSGWC